MPHVPSETFLLSEGHNDGYASSGNANVLIGIAKPAKQEIGVPGAG